MNPLDVSTPEDVRNAIIEGEFKRLVKYDATLGETEKKHIIASAEQVMKLVEQSTKNALYDLPPMPTDMFVMNIVSTIFGVVYSYIFADEDHAKESARWYSIYAGWVKPSSKNKDDVVEKEGGETFSLQIIDGKSGDFVIVSKARVNFSSIVQAVGAA